MFLKGIRAKIAFVIVMLLTVAMILILYVSMILAKKDMIRSEIEKAQMVINIFEEFLEYELKKQEAISILNIEKMAESIVQRSEISYLHIILQDIEIKRPANIDSEIKKLIENYNINIDPNEPPKKIIVNSQWSPFFIPQKNVITSQAINPDTDKNGRILIVSNLNPVQNILKKNVVVLLYYIFANLIFLTLFAIYRISEIVIKPLKNLIKKAEKYTVDEDISYFLDKQSNEFGKLSTSLNLMLNRIAEDKIQLQQNIVSLEKINSELKKAQKDIIRAEKLASIGRLSSGIAHEIGNPIAIVLGYLELLRKSEFSINEKNEFILRAENEINRIQNIIKKMLNLSRSFNDHKAKVSVHSIIQDIYETMKYQPLVSNMEISLDLGAIKDEVSAEADQLRQVFVNLVINAADAISSSKNQSSGHLVISTSLDESDDIKLSVEKPVMRIDFSDNGKGISEEQIDYIYDPFFTTKEPGKGTGLGLAVCFMIIDTIGGKITARSQDGTGTTITIYLPLQETEI